MSTLLVVDDEQSICWGLTQLGESLGHQVMTASSAEQALAASAQNKPDLIVLDVRLPGTPHRNIARADYGWIAHRIVTYALHP